VDGQENPVSVIAFAKFYEVQKYLSLTRHAYGAQSFMISKKTWDHTVAMSCIRQQQPSGAA
jgi:TRAP-type C4-dicarboxylate transport system substrate-binding protein